MVSVGLGRAQDRGAPVATPLPRPFFINPDGRFLFAWHHPAAPSSRRQASVVLCPPLGFEYVCAYRAWRRLADRISALGFDALRFDYEGTGESASSPHDADILPSWLRSVDAAISEMQSATGSEAFALVGFRFGAMLALQTAVRRGGVDRLALWNTFANGRAYVRELRALERFGRQDYVPEMMKAPDIHAEGYPISAATIAGFIDWDINAFAAPPATDVLIVDRDDRPDDVDQGRHLETLGSRLSRVRVGGTAEMLVQPMLSKVPSDALDAICGWLDEWRPTFGAIPAACRAPLGASAAQSEAFIERPLRFGPADRLFGVATVPRRARLSTSNIVLMTTGTEHRAGPNGMYVTWAREWAAAGHYVLRYDVSGVGDSGPAPGTDENVVYPASALGDLREALELAERESPGRRVIVAGLCSGGWFALEAARAKLPLNAVVAVNPPLFLRDGPDGSVRLDEQNDFIRYSQELRNPVKWRKALKGRVAYRHFARLALGAVGRAIGERLRHLAGRPIDGLASDLEEISRCGISTLLVFSWGDAGLQYFDLCTPEWWRRALARRGRAPVVIDGAGHTFRPPEAQRALGRALTDFIQRLDQASESAASGQVAY
jgi:alpha-beta hydrolase superfamily lysophospholipase